MSDPKPARRQDPGPIDAASDRALLEIKDVHVWLSGSHILQGVGFDVRRSGVTALLGRNGVGKTTTLKAILGLVPRMGSVRFDGKPLEDVPTYQVIRRGVAYVPEDRDVFSELTVDENLRLAERDREPRYGLVRQLFPELMSRQRQRAGTLSGGQQQMLALARVLLNDNRLLLVDEPTKGLAPKVVGEVVEALTRAAEVATLLLVEQNLPAVRRLAQHAIVMAEGQVVYQGDAVELMRDDALTRRLLGVAVGAVAG